MSVGGDGNEVAVCASCGQILPLGLQAKICPACLLGQGALFSSSESRVRPGDFVPPAPQDLELIFPEFSFSRLLGRGGMGAVYQAHQRELEREVAIKILPPETARDLEFQERFRREAATLAQLDHPNIVGLFDYGEREGYFYFVMEYVAGADLAVRMADAEISTKDVFAIVSQICEALDYSHARGVVHRDIKPANILIDDNGLVKIVDFGLAKVVRGDVVDPGLTRTQSSMGTPQYMAPEQMAGSEKVDHRSDIFAIGVVLYELLTGKVPAGHFKAPSVEKETLNPRLDEVVLRALRSEPDQRYQKVSDIKSGLEEAIEQPVSSANAIHVGWKMSLAAMIASVSVGAGVWWFSQKVPEAEMVLSAEPVKVFQVERIGMDGEKLPAISVTADGLAAASLSGSREGFGVGINRQGLVVAWGSNRYGQASPPPGLRAVSVVAGQGARNAHALALKHDGSVVGWGDDTFGQAIPPGALSEVKMIAAGERFSLALTTAGEVVSWGSLSVEVSGAKAIAAGEDFAVVLLEDGNLQAFGKGAPEIDAELDEVVAIAAGRRHLLALRKDGTLVAWGTEMPSELPTVKAIYAGADGSVAVGEDGVSYSWGAVPKISSEEIQSLAIGRTEVLLLR